MTIDGIVVTYRAHNYMEITVIAISYSNMVQPEGTSNRFTPRTCSLSVGWSLSPPDAAKRHLANQS